MAQHFKIFTTLLGIYDLEELTRLRELTRLTKLYLGLNMQCWTFIHLIIWGDMTLKTF